MKNIRWAWAIHTGEKLPGYIGYLWFDYMERPKPWRKGMPVALFETRKIAREHLARVKGLATQGKFPNAKVVRVRITIE